MRKKLIFSALAFAAFTCIPTADAAVTIIFNQGDYSLPSYTTASVYQSFDGNAEGATYVPKAGESTTGTVRTYVDTVDNVAADPQLSDPSAYLAVQNGTYTTTFSSPVQFFSFVFGSLDSYNTLKLTFADSTSILLTGAEIVGEGAPGPFNSTLTGRVSYDLGGGAGITSATFGSTQAAFEIDSIASAVPESSTWAMMLLGVGLIGGQLRTRSRLRSSRLATL